MDIELSITLKNSKRKVVQMVKKETFKYGDGKVVTIFDYPPYNDTLNIDLSSQPKEATLEVECGKGSVIEATPGDV